ncbi:MAG: hypothetical protein AB1416_01605 [Actinomycetota bacterium]
MANAMRRQVAATQLAVKDGWAALRVLQRPDVTRYLACALLTADARLARAPAVRCAITVLPR